MLEYVDKCHNNVRLNDTSVLHCLFVMLTNVSQMLQITCYEMLDKCYEMLLNVMKC